jgi:integrative and conjugative element protein (TIGR02256 family)
VESKKTQYILSNGGYLKIDKEALQVICSFKQVDKKDLEAGGIIMGRFIRNSKNIIIDKVTEPAKEDKRTRYSFKRRSVQHQIILEDQWSKSHGTCNYLGEWHTHPENNPSPSGIDLKDWKRKLKADIFSSRYLYFIIAGITGLEIWEGDRRTLEIKQLKK